MPTPWTLDVRHLRTSGLAVILVTAAVIAATWSTSCSAVPSNQGNSRLNSQARPKGSLRGYQAIDDQLTQSISALRSNGVGDPSSGLLAAHLPTGISSSNAKELLGGYVGGTAFDSTPSEFVNGTPIPVNMLLWTLVLRSLAGEMALVCGEGTESRAAVSKYLPDFRKDLMDWCATKSPGSFDALWLWLQGFESEAERAEVAKAIAPHLGTISTTDALFVILMNPHFLLEK
jgi:hypothetical protein